MRRLIVFLLVVCVGVVGCMQDIPPEPVRTTAPEPGPEPMQEPISIEEPEPEPVTVEPPQIVVEEPKEPEKENEQMAKEEKEEQTEQTEQTADVVIPDPAKLAPVPVYPAYLVTDGGTIFGIPSGLMGEGHKERLTITDTDGNTLQGKIGFYTVRGMLYVVREWVDQVGTEHTDYYAQDLSTAVPKIDLVDTAPKMPDVERVVFDSPEWLIKSVVLSGIEYSYLYNRHASVWGGAGDGEWVCRKNKITGFVVLENGILIMSEDGAQFCPANRKGLNDVGECGRVWK